MFEGDIRNSLGDKFPTVYFSKVSVFDDRVEVDLNCFAEEVVKDEINGSLKVYLIPIFNNNLYDSILSNPNDLFGEIIDGDRLNVAVFRDGEGRVGTSRPFAPAEISTNFFREFLIEDFEEIQTKNYNTNGNEYYKLKFSKTLQNFRNNVGFLSQLSFITFSTFLNPKEIQRLIDREDFSSPILDQVSIISHTKVIDQRLVINETFNAYLYNEQQYHGKVIQDLANNYRENSQTQFDRLLADLSSTFLRFTGTGDQQLQSFVDSCSYIVRTQNMQVDFIKQLKSVLDTFPSRTSTSPIGVFYNSLKATIFAFNDFLQTQQKLEKKLLNTLHNFDFRATRVTEINPDARANYEDLYEFRNGVLSSYNEEFIYNPYMDRTRRIQQELFGCYELKDIVDQELGMCYNHSYFLFDYEKALYKTSNISQIFNVDEVMLYFGNNCLSPYFQFASVAYGRLHRNTVGPPEEFGCSLEATFNNVNYNDLTVTPNETLVLNTQLSSIYNGYTVAVTNPDKAASEEEAFLIENDSEFTETLKSFIAQRSFDTMESVGDYKLACFEVGDIQTDVSIATAYKFRVKILDYTTNFVINRIINPARQALSGLRGYYDAASDFCSYNDLDNKFNDFFVEFINERYSEDVKPPWEFGPIWFFIIKNLLTRNSIEAASETLYNSVISQIMKISPETGDLDNIELFLQEFETMMAVFDEGGSVYELIYGGTRTDGTPTGVGLIDNIDNVFIRNIEELPQVLDKNTFIYDYEYDRVERDRILSPFLQDEILVTFPASSRQITTQQIMQGIVDSMVAIRNQDVTSDDQRWPGFVRIDAVLNAMLYYYPEERNVSIDVDFYLNMRGHYDYYVDKPRRNSLPDGIEFGRGQTFNKFTNKDKAFFNDSPIREHILSLFMYIRAVEFKGKPTDKLTGREFIKKFMTKFAEENDLNSLVARTLSTEEIQIDPDEIGLVQSEDSQFTNFDLFYDRIKGTGF